MMGELLRGKVRGERQGERKRGGEKQWMRALGVVEAIVSSAASSEVIICHYGRNIACNCGGSSKRRPPRGWESLLFLPLVCRRKFMTIYREYRRYYPCQQGEIGDVKVRCVRGMFDTKRDETNVLLSSWRIYIKIGMSVCPCVHIFPANIHTHTHANMYVYEFCLRSLKWIFYIFNDYCLPTKERLSRFNEWSHCQNISDYNVFSSFL